MLNKTHIQAISNRKISCDNIFAMEVNSSSQTISMLCLRITVKFLNLTLSSPGFFGSSQPGGHKVPPHPPHNNFFVIGRVMMKLGKLFKCYKLYLLTGF